MAKEKKAKKTKDMKTTKTNEASFDKTADKKSNNKPKIMLAIILSLVLVGLVLYLALPYFVAAIVGNQPITRFKVVQELEKRAGENVLDNLVIEQLVKMEAEKQGIEVSSEEINERLTVLEDQEKQKGTTLDNTLAELGQTKGELEEYIRVQFLIEKLLEEDIEVTDDEAEETYNANESLYGDQDFEAVKDGIKQQLRQQKMATYYEVLVERLKEEYRIRSFVDYYTP